MTSIKHLRAKRYAAAENYRAAWSFWKEVSAQCDVVSGEAYRDMVRARGDLEAAQDALTEAKG